MEDRTKSSVGAAKSAAASSAGAAAALASRRAQEGRPPDTTKRAVGPTVARPQPRPQAGAAAAAARMRKLSVQQAPASESTSPARPTSRQTTQRPPVLRINSARSTDSETSNTSARTLTLSAAAAAAQALTTPKQQKSSTPSLHSRRGSSGDAAIAASRRHSVVQPAARPELPELAEETREQARAQARKLVSAAARASSLNPKHIEPKPALQDKLLSVFAEVPERPNSAVAAAALARTNADTQIARVAQQIKDKQQRKARFQPAASWSTSRGLDPEPPGSHHLHHHLHVPHNPVRRPSSTFERESLVEKSLTPAMFIKKKMFQKLGIRKDEERRETASPEPQQPQPATMRKDKKSKFNEHKPWKHHSHAKTLTEKERRRYERLWAANRGQHIPYFAFDMVAQQSPGASSPSLQSGASTLPVGSPLMAGLAGGPNGAPLAAVASSLPRLTVTSPDIDTDARSIASFRSSVLSTDSDLADAQAEDVHGFAVANLWHRSNLPDDVLEKVWALVDHNRDGTLDRESFIVGTWLVDQCLYGRKLPTKVSDQIWTSAGRLNVKIRVKKTNKKWRHQKKITPANAAALMASRDQARSPAP